MEQLWTLTRLEWKRSRATLLVYFLATVGLWGGVVFYIPVLRNGDMSSDVVLLTTSILTSLLAARAFAGDFREGRLEFLFASGASPLAVVVSRCLVCALGSALFAAAFALVEIVRIHLTPPDLDFSSGPIYARLRGIREGFYLYVLPILGLALFASAVSNRAAALCATVIAVGGACLALDASAAARAWTPERLGFVASAWSVILVPFFAGLAAAAVWARRHEADRPNVKIWCGAAVVLVLAVRHLALETTAAPLDEIEAPRSVAISPNRRHFAIESETEWRPSAFEAWAARVLDQSSADGARVASRHVFVGSVDTAPYCAAPDGSRLDTSGDSPPWIGDGTLRIRAAESGGPPRPLLFDTGTRRLLDAPSHWSAAPRPQGEGALPIAVKPTGSPVEVVRLAGGASLWTVEDGGLELRVKDERRRLVLKPRATP